MSQESMPMPSNDAIREGVEGTESAVPDFELNAEERAAMLESHERIEEGAFIAIMDDERVGQAEAGILFGRFLIQCQEDARAEADANPVPEGVDAHLAIPRANVKGQMKFASILARTINCKELAWEEYKVALLEADQNPGMGDLAEQIRDAQNLMAAEFEASQREQGVDENLN